MLIKASDRTSQKGSFKKKVRQFKCRSSDFSLWKSIAGSSHDQASNAILEFIENKTVKASKPLKAPGKKSATKKKVSDAAG